MTPGADLWLLGDAATRLRDLPAESVHACVTSPPYFGLRDYGVAGQLGLESTPDAYVEAMVGVFREVRRVLRDDGTLWLNLGDSYASSGGVIPGARSDGIGQAHACDGLRRCGVPVGVKQKDLIGIPWMVAFALRADGWYLRSDIVWHKPNAMPESVRDRPTKGHEYLFLLSKSERYHYDADAVRESHASESLARVERGRSGDHKWADGGPGNQTLTKDIAKACHPRGRNRRTVWTVATTPFSGAHFATMPPALVGPCVLAGCPVGGTVLDPFGGAGTVALVSRRLGRSFVYIDLNPAYLAMAQRRVDGVRYQPSLLTGAA